MADDGQLDADDLLEKESIVAEYVANLDNTELGELHKYIRMEMESRLKPLLAHFTKDEVVELATRIGTMETKTLTYEEECLVNKGLFVEAIKQVRERIGSDLTTAKRLVDDYRYRNDPDDPI